MTSQGRSRRMNEAPPYNHYSPRWLPRTVEEPNPPSGTIHGEVEPIEISSRENVIEVLFLDENRFVSCDEGGSIRSWRAEDAWEARAPVYLGEAVCDMAVSGKWVVSGTTGGRVVVWDAESEGLGSLRAFQAGGTSDWTTVDLSPDGERIVTGLRSDGTVSVWSFATGKHLLGPLQHDHTVTAVKFSPNGHFIATATQDRASIRIYDSQDAHLLVDFPFQAPPNSESLAWASDSEQLFALSHLGNIICLDIVTCAHTEWPVHASDNPFCVALASNAKFIAVSNYSSVSFWDTLTHQQIGPVIDHIHEVSSMSISLEYDMVTSGNKKITLRNLVDVLPPHYLYNTFRQLSTPYLDAENAQLKETVRSLDEKNASLERAVQQLNIQLSDSQHRVREEQNNLNGAIESLRADFYARDESSKSTIAHLDKAIWEHRTQLAESQQNADRLDTELTKWRQNAQQLQDRLAKSQRDANRLRTELTKSQRNTQQLRDELAESQENAGQLDSQLAESRENAERLHDQLSKFQRNNDQLTARLAEAQQQVDRERDNFLQILRVHEQKHHCETLYAQGCAVDAARSLLDIVNALSDAVRADILMIEWISEFTNRCISKLETVGNEASSAKKHDEALAAYSLCLSLGPPKPNVVLMKWASTMLICSSVTEALGVATKFALPRVAIYQSLCDVLEGKDCISEAIACFQQMQKELKENTGSHTEQVEWESRFQARCAEKLEKLGDASMDSKNRDEAIGHYSSALSLESTHLADIVIKCCKARTGLLKEALNTANKIVEGDPRSYKGYKRKHAALHGMGRHKEAFEAFEVMLSKLQQSFDPLIRELRNQYVDSTPTIRGIIRETIRNVPRVLINTTTGRLYDKTLLATAFEEVPIFHELRSSMITKVDHARIWREAKKFYRYVMFSHKWEDHGEPALQKVESITVYKLETSLPNLKLQNLCKLVRSLGLQWVWSDTCCIDKNNNVVLQESLVAMFAWYRGSFLTVVYLRDVPSHLQKPGALRGSIWNTRTWTYQEYIASETVQFYTEDWKPYLGLTMWNHKDSPEIISEMQQASGDFQQELAVLRPGLERVREKLYLASTRQTTLTEDVAYSLLGIFNAAIPVIYGEGNRAVSRLLENILTGSGDVIILAWTGLAGSYNSALPVDLAVYDQLVPPHVPQPIGVAEIDNMVTALLDKLPSAFFTASRLHLPGIVFPVTEFSDTMELHPDPHLHIYHATTVMLGGVEIKTTDDLTGTKNLVFIHPWISSVLDQEFSQGETGLDETTRALRLVARLRQPFGALLLSPLSRAQYRRVAADSLIMVRVREETSLKELMDGIRVVDIQ